MTDQEIVRALRCCKFGAPCQNCPVVGNEDCFEEVNTAAADLIERLTAENAALLEYAKLFTGRDTCRHGNYCKTECPCDECEQDVKGNCYCKDCERGSNWTWRGLSAAPEEGGKA